MDLSHEKQTELINDISAQIELCESRLFSLGETITFLNQEAPCLGYELYREELESLTARHHFCRRLLINIEASFAEINATKDPESLLRKWVRAENLKARIKASKQMLSRYTDEIAQYPPLMPQPIEPDEPVNEAPAPENLPEESVDDSVNTKNKLIFRSFLLPSLPMFFVFYVFLADSIAAFRLLLLPLVILTNDLDVFVLMAFIISPFLSIYGLIHAGLSLVRFDEKQTALAGIALNLFLLVFVFTGGWGLFDFSWMKESGLPWLRLLTFQDFFFALPVIHFF